MSHLTCALSGQCPISDPVALPTGQIVSKALILTKLVESSANPFDSNLTLSESDLLPLKTQPEILPPKPAQANSIPSILSMLSKEYDALVLELFDTRKALEETRRELSQALYQNDAAVRVIARVVMERDLARRDLAQVSATVGTSGGVSSSSTSANKRKRDVVEEDMEVDSANVNVVPEEETNVPLSNIPSDVVDIMKKKWEELQPQRKSLSKQSETYLTSEQLSSMELSKKAYHKTSAKGICALTCQHRSGIITSLGKDKQLVRYDMENHKVISTTGMKMLVNGKAGLDSVGDTVVLVSAAENSVKVVHGDKVMTKDIDGAISAVVHPTGQHIFVATESGMIHLLVIGAEGELTEAALFSCVEKGFDGTITTIGVHPDGLILGVGRSDGKFSLYDLSTQTLAATFDPVEAGQITCMDFSEKGLHVATGSSNGQVSVWDLRKQKSIATMNIEGGTGIECTRFCPTGKFLAYGDSEGHVSVTVVKEWGVKVEMNDSTAKGKVSGLAWGEEASVLYASYSEDRSVRIWEKK